MLRQAACGRRLSPSPRVRPLAYEPCRWRGRPCPRVPQSYDRWRSGKRGGPQAAAAVPGADALAPAEAPRLVMAAVSPRSALACATRKFRGAGKVRRARERWSTQAHERRKRVTRYVRAQGFGGSTCARAPRGKDCWRTAVEVPRAHLLGSSDSSRCKFTPLTLGGEVTAPRALPNEASAARGDRSAAAPMPARRALRRVIPSDLLSVLCSCGCIECPTDARADGALGNNPAQELTTSNNTFRSAGRALIPAEQP